MKSRGLWARASRLAERTPEDRNRYVDFLRALSILAVVLGHWIMAAPHRVDDSLALHHLLDVVPWSRWLTWVFQVMPVFFFVGGYSNGLSWDGARAKGQSYSGWLESRMRRLLGPVVPLVFLWALLAIAGNAFGVPAEMIRIGSQVALVPIWFLAIYLLIVILVPVSRHAWHRFGVASFAAPAFAAALTDLAFFRADMQWLGWFNYLFVWIAVHQLGYAWRDGVLHGAGRGLLMCAFGLAALIVMTQYGPYPTSLVGVPSQAISNTTPPKLPLLALGCAQIGLLLALEALAKRWLAMGWFWIATILMNGIIMTVFLWHSTAMMLTIGLGSWLWPPLFDIEPGTGAWWSLRPIWVLVFGMATAPFLAVFIRVDRTLASHPSQNLSLPRLLGGAVMIGLGLALLALGGIGGDGPLGLNWIAALLPLLGASLAGFGPLAHFSRRQG